MGDQQRKMESRLAWLGGFWDGEGSVTMAYRQPKKRGQRAFLTPQVSVVNTDLVPLNEVAPIFNEAGIAYWRSMSSDKGANCKPLHRLLVGGIKRCARVLPLLLPHLIAKRGRAEQLLRFCQSRLERPGRAPYTLEELVIAVRVREGHFDLDFKSLTDYTPDAVLQAAMV
jgi:hypothetical protein